MSSQFRKEPTERIFVFGGGEKTKSLGKYTIPVYFMDTDNNMHMLFLALEVVEQDIVMLLGSNSLTKAEAILDLGKQFLALPKMFAGVNFPFHYINGHYILNFYNLAKEDGHEAAQIFLTSQSWDKKSASSLLNYVKFDKRPKFHNVVDRVYNVRTHGKHKKDDQL